MRPECWIRIKAGERIRTCMTKIWCGPSLMSFVCDVWKAALRISFSAFAPISCATWATCATLSCTKVASKRPASSKSTSMKSGNRALSLSPSLLLKRVLWYNPGQGFRFHFEKETTSVSKEFSRINNTSRKNSSKFMWVYVVNFLSVLDFFHGFI